MFVNSFLGCTNNSSDPIKGSLKDSNQLEDRSAEPCVQFKPIINDLILELLEKSRNDDCLYCRNLYVDASMKQNGKVRVRAILSEGLLYVDKSVGNEPNLLPGYYTFLGEYNLFLFESSLNSGIVTLKCNPKPVHDRLIKGGKWIEKEFEINSQS